MRSIRTDQGRDAPVREQIKGHTVGSDGIVYNPDTASFGYISQLDSRVENNSSNETMTLVTDQGRHVPVTAPAAGGGVAQAVIHTAGGGVTPDGGGTTGVGAPSGRKSTSLGVLNIGNTKAPWLTQETPPDFSYAGHEGLIPMKRPGEQPGRQFPFGPFPLELNPYVPSAQAIEDELGEAEFLSPGFFANWMAQVGHLTWNLERLDTHVRGVGEDWRADTRDRMKGGMPAQEPVDWGQ